MQRCIGHQPAKPVVDRFITRHGFRKRAALARGKRGEPALEILFEGRAFAVRQIQVALHLGAVEGGVKVPEVPLGQVAEFGGLIQCFPG